MWEDIHVEDYGCMQLKSVFLLICFQLDGNKSFLLKQLSRRQYSLLLLLGIFM